MRKDKKWEKKGDSPHMGTVPLFCFFAVLLAVSTCFAIDYELGSGDVEGVVTGPDGSALQGASVMLDGSAKQTYTNLRGYYHLKGVAAGRRIIICKKEN